jgi:rhamnose utilization protein RhaD (predicted bifunctional aldolase and dehydrogenase)/NAD(P)-dependent dehydrogenase (short-subunit alcohol dehydrogenase family)
MKSRWDNKVAKKYTDDLSLRVYTSKLLGSESTLVLHGGGNTSVKINKTNIVGEREEILFVKGSGHDLATIESNGFSPVKMQHLLKLAELDRLSDPEMVSELKTNLINPNAPTPSVEAILHAILPHKFVDHTHADAVITITNTSNGNERIKEIYGNSMIVIPYVMPGFDLAKLVAKQYHEEVNENTIGLILLNHGVFTFGKTAKESYERMINTVDRAEKYLRGKNAWDITYKKYKTKKTDLCKKLATLRYEISRITETPMIIYMTGNFKGLFFSNKKNIEKISQRGPVTPDHVIRTKQLPMLGENIKKYTESYKSYFKKYESQSKDKKNMLDPAPRVMLDKNFGLCTIGKNKKEANVISDIYIHTIDCILRAEKLGGWQALPSKDIFQVEYWDLEQAKLKKSKRKGIFEGEIVLITGAANGIGKACVSSFLDRGAAVIAIDIDKKITRMSDDLNYLGIIADITNETAIQSAVEKGIKFFGGIDMLVLNAGIFPKSCNVENTTSKKWREVMKVNLDANLSFLRICHPYLVLAPKKGRVVIIGSKNVHAPGPGAAAYSASKAALTQLMRVVALEWGENDIRINMIHPDGIFDTRLWSKDLLRLRAKKYKMTIKEYKEKNILGVEVTSNNVSELCATMCGPLFENITAAQIPIDGGNERVI